MASKLYKSNGHYVDDKVVAEIRADAIDECIKAIEDTKSLFDNSTKWTMAEKTRIQNRLRELKEQNK